MAQSVELRLKFYGRKGFWLAILLHLLFFTIFFIVISQSDDTKKPPHYYVPAYTYSGAMSSSNKKTTNKENRINPQKNTPIKSIEKSLKSAKATKAMPLSMLAASLNSLKNFQNQSLRNSNQDEEPMLLVGDVNEMSDPLMRMLGKALSKYFDYPKEEGMFGIKGKALIEMTLHPEGYFSDVRLVKSTNNKNLDAAALFAVNKAPTIYGVDRFISQPKRFLVGFVFY